MFKGFTKSLQKKLEKYNQTSEYFIFCVADLEEREGERDIFSIHSPELRKKLGNIIASSGGTMLSPTAVKFSEVPPLIKRCGIKNYENWIKINKKFLAELNQSNSSRIITYNNGKDIEGEFEVASFGLLYHWLNQKLNFLIGGWNTVCKMRDEEEYKIKEHNKKVRVARSNALTEINQSLSKNNIDIEAAEIFWPSILPDLCQCEVKETGNPENNNFHKQHINNCLWREASEINAFKDKVLTAIENGKKRFDDYKTQTIQKIINQANQQNITETELNHTRSGWQTHLKSLTNREQITNYQNTQLEKDIQNLVAAKSKSASERQQAEQEAQATAKQEEERLKKEQEQKAAEAKNKQDQETKKQAEEQAKQQELSQKRDQSIAQITTALSQEPPLTNSELSPQYQNWEEQLNQLTDLPKITHLQDRILADIQARRHDKKVAQEVKENLNQARTGTPEEKAQAFANLEQQETEKGYQDNQEEVENLKKEQATKDPNKYSQEAKQKIEQKLQDNGIKAEDLNPENQQELKRLENGEITDPNQLVATETKIKQNIYQEEAKKKITDFTSRVKQVLKSQVKSQIDTLKKELLAFISSSNIYYASQKQQAENLLSQLENYSTSNDNNDQNNSPTKSPTSSPWKIVIPLLLLVSLGVLLIASAIVVRRVIKRKKKQVKR